MKRGFSTAATLYLILPVVVFAQTAAQENELALPGDQTGTAMPSDGLAECAAILAAAASKSTNIVHRGNMKNSAATWFAASGNLAITEGVALLEDEVWATKVEDWSARIGSIDAMAQHGEWMAYCSELGKELELNVAHFSVAVEPVSEPEVENN